jgi:antitoxin component HigA of HigAB toxin-antitoxin module
MTYPGRTSNADRYKVHVARLVRKCMDGEVTYKEAARSHPPIIVLLAYMQREGIAQMELARRLGTSQTTVSFVLSGLQVPTPALRQRLEAVCLIPVESWDKAWKAA